jgi:CHAT domain-containing protein
MEENVLKARLAALPPDHPDVQMARGPLASTIAAECARLSRRGNGDRRKEMEEGRERCASLIVALSRAETLMAREVLVSAPCREAEERCAKLAESLDRTISFACGYGVFERTPELETASFELCETTRGAALAAADFARKAAGDARYADLRETLASAGNQLGMLVRKEGTTSGEFDRLLVKREAVERELLVLAGESPGAKETGVHPDVESLAARLLEHEAAVGFRSFRNTRMETLDEFDSTGQPGVREIAVESLCAFVLRSSRGRSNAGPKEDSATAPLLALVDLGPIAPIREAVRAWRHGLGVANDDRGVGASAREATAPDVRQQGTLLRAKILDPLLPALAGAQHLVLALDDALHLVPLDALPLEEGGFVGDRWRIETRATLTELVADFEPLGEGGRLVALGDVQYEAPEPLARSEAAVELPHADGQASESEHASILRGGAWAQGFSALPGTGVEVRGIARCFTDHFGADAALELCDHAAATRERLFALASAARFLHIATHGWFAPESIKSWSDPEPLDKRTGLGMRLSGEEQVKGMSPMLLCGLALAGANLPDNAAGRAPGLVTADELSTLDLTKCELVVLSACDTNVGERRAGQGVASLQKALQMAGARSVITSLWKVPDEATKDLMLDFYRRLWVEKKPKHQALWEAKTKLRETKDESGRPKYTTRDWAAWVLTGDPN